MRKEHRKVLEWSCDEDERLEGELQSEKHQDRILGDFLVDDTDNSGRVSPSQIQL